MHNEFYEDVRLMIWIHFGCFALFIVKKMQRTLPYYGAYTKVFFAWCYTFIYSLGVLYVTFNLRLWRQVRHDIESHKRSEVTKKFKGVYKCLVKEFPSEKDQRLFNHESDRVITQFRQLEEAVFIAQIVGIFLYLLQS